MTVTKRTKPRPAAIPGAPVVRSVSFKRRMARQRLAAYAIAGVALVLTGLSLSHLAHGVQALTNAAMWHAWAMSIGIDLGFIGLELGQLCITTEQLRQRVSKFADPTVIGTLGASALMNAYAFALHTTDFVVMTVACALGVAIPALIYVLTRVSVALWLDSQR